MKRSDEKLVPPLKQGKAMEWQQRDRRPVLWRCCCKLPVDVVGPCCMCPFLLQVFCICCNTRFHCNPSILRTATTRTKCLKHVGNKLYVANSRCCSRSETLSLFVLLLCWALFVVWLTFMTLLLLLVAIVEHVWFVCSFVCVRVCVCLFMFINFLCHDLWSYRECHRWGRMMMMMGSWRVCWTEEGKVGNRMFEVIGSLDWCSFASRLYVI